LVKLNQTRREDLRTEICLANRNGPKVPWMGGPGSSYAIFPCSDLETLNKCIEIEVIRP